MKRIIAIILVCVLAFSIASCDKKKNSDADKSKDSEIIAPVD